MTGTIKLQVLKHVNGDPEFANVFLDLVFKYYSGKTALQRVPGIGPAGYWNARPRVHGKSHWDLSILPGTSLFILRLSSQRQLQYSEEEILVPREG